MNDSTKDSPKIRLIACSSIIDRDSYRRDVGDLSGLQESIEAVGLLQPIIVSPDEQGYVLLAGRRRLATFRNLNRAMITALIIPTDSSQRIEIQNDENSHRKPLSTIEKVQIARALRPLMQKEAEKRRAQGVKSDAEKGSTRELVARRVGLSHDTLTKAEYVYDHYEVMQDRAARATQSGQTADVWPALAEKLGAIVDRMDALDHKHKLTISAAYKEARDLLGENKKHGKEAANEEPVRTVRIVTQFAANNGKRIPVQISVNLSMDDPPKELVRSALQAAITALIKSDEQESLQPV